MKNGTGVVYKKDLKDKSHFGSGKYTYENGRFFAFLVFKEEDRLDIVIKPPFKGFGTIKKYPIKANPKYPDGEGMFELLNSFDENCPKKIDFVFYIRTNDKGEYFKLVKKNDF